MTVTLISLSSEDFWKFTISRTSLLLYKSADEALNWLRNASHNQAPDIIFLDLNMPEVDGFSFLKNFKDLPDLIKTKSKIVVLTSSNSAKDRSQAFTFPNVIQFITKPLKQSDIEDLKKLINHNEFTGQANL